MDIHKCIRTRRSIRKYTGEAVPREKLQRVLEAVQWAPSWVNFQVWEVVVVDDPAVKARLQECVSETNPGRKALTMAPIVLAMCGRRGKSGYYDGKPTTVHGDWAMFDLGIACQNLCLAAWAEGLGTLHLGLLDHEKAGEVLALPDGVEVYELIPLGAPAKQGKAPPRRKIEEFTHGNRFGEPFSLE
jgi:nitroreductase